MERLSVNSPHGPYPVHIGPGAVTALSDLIRSGGHDAVFVLVDENTRRHCLPKLPAEVLSRARVLEIPSGERHKTLETCQRLWSELLAHRATRHALLVNLGGGVIGDLGGWVAASYKRGIAFVQVPTTPLAQVDASIGGKLGIDFEGIKNAVGTFASPVAVLADPDFFGTLPRRELRAGFAEMLKHALIADPEQWESLSRLPDDLGGVDWTAHLRPSLEIKKAFVEKDPSEKGPRKALNFGHTLGHALESWALAQDRPLLHGEAVALGMIGEARLSVPYAGLPEPTARHIQQTIERFFPLAAEGLVPQELPRMGALRPFLSQDKKNLGDRIGWVLLEKIGRWRAVELFDSDY